MTVTALPFLGQSGGDYLFGGGQLTVTDPADQFEIQGSFDGYTLNTTVETSVVSSFALFSSFWTIDVADPSLGPSAFLDDFGNTNLMGNGFTQAQWMNVHGVDFTFITSSELAAATNGFTQSAVLPATVLISLNGSVDASVPAVSEIGLLALATLMALAGAAAAVSWRRRAVSR